MKPFRARLRDLRPTQECVGYLEVDEKVRKLARLSDPRRRKVLRAHPIPVVIGPKGKLYVIDHHHLALALWRLDYRHAWVKVVEDFSGLTKKEFWPALEKAGDLYLHDRGGKPVTPADLPRHIRELEDDPYRSLAGAVRRKGGFTKSPTPYAEFAWASFFRDRVDFRNTPRGLKDALPDAIRLARTARARRLPGFSASRAARSGRAPNARGRKGSAG